MGKTTFTKENPGGTNKEMPEMYGGVQGGEVPIQQWGGNKIDTSKAGNGGGKSMPKKSGY